MQWNTKYDLNEMTRDELLDLKSIVDMRLQDLYYAEMDDALTMGITPGELKEPQRSEYIAYLEEIAGPGETPYAKQLLSEWYAEKDDILSQEDRATSMRTTGA